jgi:hypothetical protein
MEEQGEHMISRGGRRVAGFGLGEDPPPVYELGKQSIPISAPTGTIVKESSGSAYETTCTKQANGSWVCSNGSKFAAGDLELRGTLICKTGEIVAGQWGICVPVGGLALSDGNNLLPDGSIKSPDGTIVFDGSTGTWGISDKQKMADMFAAIEQTIGHPIDTISVGSFEIGRTAGTIVGNAAQGAVTGLVNPTEPNTTNPSKPAQSPTSPTWLYWAGGVLLLAVGGFLVVPIVREVIATRQIVRLVRRVEPDPT